MKPFIAILAILVSSRAWGGGFSLPKADEIVSFANNPVFQYVSLDIYQPLSKGAFLKFLKSGIALSIDTPSDDKRLQGPTTYHEPLNDWARKLVKLEQEEGPGVCQRRCQGVAATKNALYFWELRNDNVLWISDEQGPGCYLRKH
jgi:hypothetical protein